MAHLRLPATAALAALALAFQPLAAFAQGQSSPGWFIPNQHPVHQVPARPAVHPAPVPAAPLEQPRPAPQRIRVQLPPPPKVPPIARAAPPPAAVIGILSVPEVLRLSTAYQKASKVISGRQKSLSEDARKEQVTLRDLGQKLATERAKLTPEQIRQKERSLRNRIDESRRKFGERNRIIQEASQYVLAQIDRAMEVVAQQVALSHGINLVLNRAQVLGTTDNFDITPEVAKVLNKVLPEASIPPPGVSPVTLHPAKQGTAATGSEKGKSGPAKVEHKH